MQTIDQDRNATDPYRESLELHQDRPEQEYTRFQHTYDEFAELMSLALDERIAPHQQERFERLLDVYPQLNAEYALWDFLDQQFRIADDVAPPEGFASRMAGRLIVAERRRRLRFGIMIALTYVVLWGTIAVGTASLGMLLFWARPEWLVELLVAGRVWMASLGTWLDALRTTAMALLSTPQIRNAGLIYVVVTIVLLFGWMRILRHWTRTQDTFTHV